MEAFSVNSREYINGLSGHARVLAEGPRMLEALPVYQELIPLALQVLHDQRSELVSISNSFWLWIVNYGQTLFDAGKYLDFAKHNEEMQPLELQLNGEGGLYSKLLFQQADGLAYAGGDSTLVVDLLEKSITIEEL